MIDVDAGLFGEALLLMLSLSTDFPVTEEGALAPKGQNAPPEAVAVRVSDLQARHQLSLARLAQARDNARRIKSNADKPTENCATPTVPGPAQAPASTAGLAFIIGGAQDLESTDGTTAQG